jgi:FG-GAP repeat
VGALRLGASEQSDKNPGAAYVFSRNQGGSNNWGEVKKLLPDKSTKYDNRLDFGFSVAVEGEFIAVSAPSDSVDINKSGDIDCEFQDGLGFGEECFTGSIRVFQKDEGGSDVWGQQDIIPLRAYTLKLNQDLLFAGTAPTFRELGTDDGNPGNVYIFKQEADVWEFFKGLTANLKSLSGGNVDPLFGAFFAVSGSKIVVGSPGYNKNVGTFDIYEE